MVTDVTISHYSIGTATVAANGTAVTGQGTAWAGEIRTGDLFGTHRGLQIRILSINSNTSLTLAHPWPGAAQTAAPYEIQRTPRDIGLLRAVEGLIADVSEGSLPLLAALLGAPNKLAYFDSSHSMALADLTALGRSLLASASPAALWSAAGLSDGYVSLTGTQTIAASKEFTGFIVAGRPFNGRIRFPGLGAAPTLALNWQENGRLGFWDETNGRWYFEIFQDSINGVGLVPPGHVSHLSGASGDGWVRLSNQASGSTVLGSLRVGTNGGFSYVFDDVQMMGVNLIGNASFAGSLTAASKSFLIDHPLDPFNKDLVFAATESPGLFVEFTGRATLIDGRVTINIDATAGMMPGTWDALATDNLIKALVNESSFARLCPGPVLDGKFEIICEDETSADTVVWTVIGRRRDPFVMDPDNPMTDALGRLIIEPEKPEYDPKMEDEIDAH